MVSKAILSEIPGLFPGLSPSFPSATGGRPFSRHVQWYAQTREIRRSAQGGGLGGNSGSSWKTIETGCANELDYRFVDGNSAAFGLNNYIYLLKRQGDAR
jgi:hypothetical protein